MSDPMTMMFGPRKCRLCSHEHASGFDCVAEQARAATRFSKLAAKSVRRIPATPVREPIYQRIGAWIKIMRKAQNLTQEDVSAPLGITRTSLVNIEAGRQRISVDQFILIAKTVDPQDTSGVLAAFRLIVSALKDNQP